MRRLALALLIALATASLAAAHPAPFSYLDVELGERAVEVTLVAHAFDVAHELALESPEEALDPALLAKRRDDLVARLSPRFQLAADDRALSCRSAAAPEALPDRSAVRLRFSCPSEGPA